MEVESIQLKFIENGRDISKTAVEVFKGVVSKREVTMDLDGVELNPEKDSETQLETRIKRNLTVMSQIIADQLDNVRSSPNPDYMLAKLLPMSSSQIKEKASSYIDTLDMDKEFPIAAIVLTEYQDLISKRDHGAMLKIVSGILGSRLLVALPLIEKILEDRSIVSAKVLDQLYMAVGNVGKLCRKYYARTLLE